MCQITLLAHAAGVTRTRAHWILTNGLAPYQDGLPSGEFALPTIASMDDRCLQLCIVGHALCSLRVAGFCCAMGGDDCGEMGSIGLAETVAHKRTVAIFHTRPFS